MSEAKKQQEWDSGVYGMFWAHTVYGGDDLDSMMQCTLDSQKVQTVGVRVQLPDGGVDFHMNVDRLGYVDRNEGERAFNLNVQAARLFVAAPELLAALEEIEMIAAKNAGPGLVDIRIIAYKAIAKAKGGE
tara:strand:- start:721 stop:1113 length:393 start_codon:yes stop_codon:yes gene_type:complete